MNNSDVTTDVKRLVATQQPGYSLQQPFYCDPDIFALDMQQVFAHQWMLVDHVSRIPSAGDYFLFSIGNEELIIVRQDEGRVGGFFNVCRHRGSRVCLEREGRRKLFTCPYHAWSYDIEGRLRSARLMDDNFDANDFGLNPCHVRVSNGFIFVNLAIGVPPDFDQSISVFEPMLEWHGFAHAKIAAKRNYPSSANWKLLIENFLECYHCPVAHPELSQARSPESLGAFGSGPGSGAGDSLGDAQQQLKDFESRIEALAHPNPVFEEAPGSTELRQVGRAPIKPGSVSETKDGKPASTLMGQFKDYDGGITMLTFNPLSYVYASNDFAILFRFTPLDLFDTAVELTWLVDEQAEEGIDYTVENLTWTLDPTLWQDKAIVERNQLGIRSARYQPGRYSEAEGMVVQFQQWYLNKINPISDR